MPSQPVLYRLSLALVACIYLLGMNLELMDLDATQYALISKQMLLSKNYLQVYWQGIDYLDKPPLLFWTSVLSFKIFGVNHFAYRLPSVMVTVLGLYSLYRFAQLYYIKKVAQNAVLIAACCQAYFLMQHDVRTDTLLTGFVLFSLWQLGAFFMSSKLIHVVWAGLGIGLAMLSKGPIGLMVPAIAFSVHFLYQRQWKYFWRWEYIVILGILAVLLAPMCYGLYTQFDMHPEKIVNGVKSPSGIGFYFWSQSFGRITGNNPWNNNPDPFFLYHSFLWSFLPWSLLFIPALVLNIRERIRLFKTGAQQTELISTGGFVFLLLLMSRSSYQLPHYTFMIHPLAAIIVADYLDKQHMGRLRLLNNVLLGVTLLALATACVLLLYSFGVMEWHYALFVLLLVATGAHFYYHQRKIENALVFAGLFFICAANVVLNAHAYKKILQYQSDSEVAKFLEHEKAETLYLACTELYNSGYFYFSGTIIPLKSLQQLPAGNHWVLCSKECKEEWYVGHTISIEKEFDDFPVSELSPAFLNPDTREKQLKKIYLLKVQR